MTEATKHVHTGSVEDGADKSLRLVSSQKSPSQRSPSQSAAVVTAATAGGEGGSEGGGDSVSKGGSGDGRRGSVKGGAMHWYPRDALVPTRWSPRDGPLRVG